MVTDASLELSTSPASSPVVETNASQPVAEADASDFECPICCDLLLDPIVGKFLDAYPCSRPQPRTASRQPAPLTTARTAAVVAGPHSRAARSGRQTQGDVETMYGSAWWL